LQQQKKLRKVEEKQKSSPEILFQRGKNYFNFFFFIFLNSSVLDKNSRKKSPRLIKKQGWKKSGKKFAAS